MPRAHKTAHINTRGYYPPRALYAPMEPREEEIMVIVNDEDQEEEVILVEDMDEDEEEDVIPLAPAPEPP